MTSLCNPCNQNLIFQVDFSLSQSSVILNLKKDYYCHVRSNSILDEGSLSFKVLSSELTDKLAYVANIALPTIIEDVSSWSSVHGVDDFFMTFYGLPLLKGS